MNSHFNVDTGGIDITDEPFMSNIRMQAEIAMEEADVITFWAKEVTTVWMKLHCKITLS